MINIIKIFINNRKIWKSLNNPLTYRSQTNIELCIIVLVVYSTNNNARNMKSILTIAVGEQYIVLVTNKFLKLY